MRWRRSSWFFQVDFIKGKNQTDWFFVEINGAQKKLVMAREMRLQNQTIT
jgi:hypothetical protein